MNDIVELMTESTQWEKYKSKDLNFPADSVVEAYQKGKQQGQEEYWGKQTNRIHTDLKSIEGDIDALVQKFNSAEIHLNNVKLRINDVGDYDLLIFVPHDDYVSENFLQAFEITDQISDSRSYEINFSFVSDDDNLSLDEIALDGFVLSNRRFIGNEAS